jgi:hypothetical protein
VAVARDPEAAQELVRFFQEKIVQARAREALSERFNPNHNGRTMQTELEKLGGARTLARLATGELDGPDEGPVIDPDERRRRDLYRKHVGENRG